MRSLRIVIVLVPIIIFYGCNHSKTESTTVFDDFEPATYSKAEQDSIKFLFDQNIEGIYSYRITYLKVKKIDSLILFQGDIEIAPNIDSASFVVDTNRINISITKGRQAIGITPTSTARLWENRTIRYKISDEGLSPGFRSKINQAIAKWKPTGLIFEEISDNSGDFILFESLSSTSYNTSALGRQQDMQLIRLRPDAEVGNIIHELGHALGLWHEHSRPDRDKYIKVLKNNIDPSCIKEFEVVRDPYSYQGTSYDYASIMHYNQVAFAKKDPHGRSMTTLEPLQPGKAIGQRNGPSSDDIKCIKRMYRIN